MEILRHVKWAITPALPVGYADDGGIDFCHREVTGDITQHGRIGVRLNGDWLEVKQLAGEALPADLLLPVLDKALGVEWREEAERLHLSRKNRWKIEVRSHMSGATDYLLRVLKDAKMEDSPIVAGIHVSMYGKLNREISMWLGDVPPLLAALQRTWPPRKPESFTLEEALISPYGGWQPAGQASGLEIIETKKKRIYTGDEDGDWEKVALINEDDIKTDSNGRKIYEYWNGTQLDELVLVDGNGNSLWQIDEDLDTATEVAREVRGDVEVILYAGKYDNALLERPLREPVFGRVYWLPTDITDIDAAYQDIAAHSN